MKKITGLIALLVLGIITTAWARPASDVAMQAMGTKGFAREKIQMFDSGTGRHRIGDRYKDVQVDPASKYKGVLAHKGDNNVGVSAERTRLRNVSKVGSNSVGILTELRNRHNNSIATTPGAALGKIGRNRNRDSMSGAIYSAPGSSLRSRHSDLTAGSPSAALGKIGRNRNGDSIAGAGKIAIMTNSGSRITSAISKSSYKSSFTRSY